MPGYRILIVDDSQFSRMSLRFMLESHRHQVVGEAVNGTSAIEAYKSSRPDLVAMDLNMPDSNGIDAIRGIEALDPKARFVIVSAVSPRLLREVCAGLATCEYLLKPVNWPALEAAMEKLMRTPGKSSTRNKNAKNR